MTVIQLVRKDKGLVKAFQRFKEWYFSIGKKPDVKKLFPDLLYSEMRSGGEKITRKQAEASFK